MATERIRTYLEMTSRDQLIPGKVAPQSIRLASKNDPPEVLEVYQRVGKAYGWRQAVWTVDNMTEHLSDLNVYVWFFEVENEPIGFLKVVLHPEQTAQIGTFGLLPDWIGKGFGGAALTLAIQTAWDMRSLDNGEIQRVWLRTLTTDHPNAMPNYLARGFIPFKTETVEE